MKITRNTLRADGLTVGEVMDKEAAFLRSVGIDAKDGAPTIDERKEECIEKFRAAVLEAMDEFAAEMPRCTREDGPKDQELPDLFRAIDPIATRIFWKSYAAL